MVLSRALALVRREVSKSLKLGKVKDKECEQNDGKSENIE